MRLTVRDLDTAVLKGCCLTVTSGEIVTVRGPSGSGKSILLRAIADLDPNTGDVRLDGTDRSAMTGPQWRRQVRFVAAEAAWWAERVGMHFHQPDRMRRTVVDLGLAGDCMDWSTARLSTGEKQRLGVLRAVEDAPRVLLLDEPTAALDQETELKVEHLIRRCQTSGAAIVIVTHSDDQAERLANRGYMIAGSALREEP